MEKFSVSVSVVPAVAMLVALVALPPTVELPATGSNPPEIDRPTASPAMPFVQVLASTTGESLSVIV